MGTESLWGPQRRGNVNGLGGGERRLNNFLTELWLCLAGAVLAWPWAGSLALHHRS